MDNDVLAHRILEVLADKLYESGVNIRESPTPFSTPDEWEKFRLDVAEKLNYLLTNPDRGE